MKKLFLENIGMKVTAVILAIILWFFVTSRGQSEMSLEIPLELKNIPKGLESVKQGTKAISISIKGQERLLKHIKPSDVRVYVDLSKARKGKGTYYIKKDDVNVPSTMTITNISPSSVWIVLEETVTKTVLIRSIIIGSPKKGFIVTSIETVPKDVTIEGAKAEVSSVRFLKTEPVDISDLDKTFKTDVRLDPEGRNIRTGVEEVNVKVVIKPALVGKGSKT